MASSASAAASETSDANKAKISREAFRRQKELEEMRKLGAIAAEVDEEGKDINPHIPQYISKAPWYYQASGPTLRHQRPQEDKQKQYADIHHSKVVKGVKEHSKATRYRKGACANCGSMTHKKSECVERPRRVGAKFTNKDIAPDEYVVPDLNLSFEGKRDRWNSYDPSEHMEVVEEYQKVEQMKRQLKKQQLLEEAKRKREEAEAAKAQNGQEEADANGEQAKDKSATKRAARDDDDDSSSSDSEQEDEDELKYAETADMAGQKFDAKNRHTVRNLRIREDTAKYLRNLDVNSAYYDPKTRSMRGNPYAHTGKAPQDLPFAGDNFVRYTGDVTNMARKQMFAWEASERGAELHLQADPTMLELMHKKHEQRKDEFQSKVKQSIIDKYGGQEHLDAPPKELLLAQTEAYVEYSQTGRVIKGQEKATVSSKYEEDVHPGNHTSVWGSWWKDGTWGYACCWSTERNSYCTGEAGKQARMQSTQQLGGTMSSSGGNEVQREEDQERSSGKAKRADDAEEGSERSNKKRRKKRKHKKGDDSEGSGEEEEREAEDREKKIQKFMRMHAEEEEAAKQRLSQGDRERSFNSSKGDFRQVTEEEMEAYYRRKQQDDDPMRDFLGKEE